MVIKAFIKNLPDIGDNHYQIRIPFFEDNTNQESIFTAIMTHQPGGYGGYQVGDCVLIAFEDDKLKVPIILGKLDTGEIGDSLGSLSVNNLNITDSVSLPSNTKIGTYSGNDIFKLLQNVSVLEKKVLELENMVKDLRGDKY